MLWFVRLKWEAGAGNIVRYYFVHCLCCLRIIGNFVAYFGIAKYQDKPKLLVLIFTNGDSSIYRHLFAGKFSKVFFFLGARGGVIYIYF